MRVRRACPALTLPLVLLFVGACAGARELEGTPLAAAPRGAPAPARANEWTISSEHASVVVSREPYSFRLRDAAGRTLLTTHAGADGAGFAATAWTRGRVHIHTLISPGYFEVEERFEAFREPQRAELVELRSEVIRLRLWGDAGDPPVHTQFTVRASGVRVSAWLDGEPPRAWSVAFVAPPDEGYLGFGERFNAVDQRGQEVYNWAEEGGIGRGEGTRAGPDNPFPNGALMSYYPVPYFVSTGGYGFWLDTDYYSRFDLQRTRAGQWRALHHGPRLDLEIYLPSAKDPRPWPYQLTDHFTHATGRPMLPPAWAFGPRRRVNRGAQRDGVPELQAMRDRDLPITAADDAEHFFPAAEQRGHEAQIAEWTAHARSLGVRVNAYFNSFVAQGAPTFREFVPQARERGFFLLRRDGEAPNLWILTDGEVVQNHLIDFTQPEAKRWYQAQFEPAFALGYSGFMYDFGEYVPADVIAHDGRSGEALHNVYPVEYARALHEALRASPHAADWFAFMRSGYTGSSAFVPMVWAGDPAASFEDSDGLPSMLRAGLNLGISGAPFWGGDIGGYHCIADGARAADAELMVRWIQQGALSPNMQVQDACVGSNPAHKASIWNSELVEGAWRRYARLHTRLFPYLYTWAKRAHERGEPLMRPLFFEHPQRPELARVDDAYYLGPALLVAPVLERGARSKRAVLPDAVYLDWDSGQLVAGGERQLDAPLEHLPLLLRAGHIVPLLDASIDTLAAEAHPDVVGPSDVADRYDVRVLLSPSAPRAELELHDGSRLAVWMGDGKGFARSGGRELEVSARGDVDARGLHFRSSSPRTLRWRVTIAE